MNIPSALPLRKPTPALPCVARMRVEDADVGAGCGWFESSHDLARGLLVCEHHSVAAVPGDALPVADWLALQIAGWTAAARPS